MVRYVEHVARPGINKIDGRKYYCFIDDNNTVCVIPDWYRWLTAVLVVIMFFLGFATGWKWS